MKGLRVLQIGQSIASSYCTRMFAGTGAEVVLVEPAEGGRMRQVGPFVAGSDRRALHEYLQAGKESVVLDEALLDTAIAWSDLVVSDCDGDPEATFELERRVRRLQPAAVHVAISGFGLTGPLSTWRSSPLIDWAAGGYLYITGAPDREPIQGGGPWASYLTGSTAAIGAQAALFHAGRTGVGQLVDISAMESVASGHQWSMTLYTHTGAIKGRWGTRFGESYHPMSLYECGDGRWVCIGAPSREQWENFCIATDAVELLADDALYAPGTRFERAAEIDARIADWLSARTASQVVEELQANRVTASEVQDFIEVIDTEQLHLRGFFDHRPDLHPDALVPNVPFEFAGIRSLGAAPELGAETQTFIASIAAAQGRSALPSVDLSTQRVVEFSVAWAGPLTGRYLAELGLQVLKIEHPTARGLGTGGFSAGLARGDDWEWGELAPAHIRSEVYPDADPGDRPWNRMGVWNKINRGKQSLCLDAKADGGGEVLHRLIERADVLLNNYSPRGARSLGIDDERLRAINPDIISVAMTGYGETGPLAAHASYGPILEAFSGFDQATGYADLAPIRIGLAFPDAVGGAHGTFAVLASIWERAATGERVHVDLSQLETLLCYAGELVLAASSAGEPPQPMGNRSLDASPQGVYPTKIADRWVAITVEDDVAWMSLLDAAQIDEPSGWRNLSVEQRREQSVEIDKWIGSWTSTAEAMEVASLLQAHHVVACPAFTNADIVDSEQIQQREFMVELDHPDVGPRLFPGSPLRLSATPVIINRAPSFGEHNTEVLSELGYSPEQIGDLLTAGTIGNRPPES